MDGLRNDIQKLTDAIKTVSSKISSMDENISSIKADVANITTELTSMRREINMTKNDVYELKDQQDSHSMKIHNLDAKVNKLEQLQLANQLQMHNVPPKLTPKQILDDLDKWAGDAFDSRMIDKLSIGGNRKFHSKIAFITFATIATKSRFLNFVKSKQKDENGSYIPILNENVFELSGDDTMRGREINFRSPMSDGNRAIFQYLRNEGRAVHQHIQVWIAMSGQVMMRTSKDEKPIIVETLPKATSIIDGMTC